MAPSDDWKKIDDVLAWAYATLLQVERVEQCWKKKIKELPRQDVDLNLTDDAESRFLLVAANHLVTAVDRCPRRLGIPHLARDLEGVIEHLRDIYEHWEKLRHEQERGLTPTGARRKLFQHSPTAVPWSTQWDPTNGITIAQTLRVRDLEEATRAVLDAARVACAALPPSVRPGITRFER